MKVPDRELVILLPQGRDPSEVLERQTLRLHELLNQVETTERYVQAIELLNLHRGGISHNRIRIEMALAKRTLGAFEFLLHKN